MMTGKIIENMLEEAWNKFIEYFNRNTDKYARNYFNEHSQILGEKKVKRDIKDSHWICWNESDLMMQLSRYFYSQREIKSVSDEKFLEIEMHLDKNLNLSNFAGYEFGDKLRKKGALETELGRFPKLDLIITGEESLNHFLLCAEAKYFHSSVMYGTVYAAIDKDIKTLSVIKKLEIADKIAYIILDDFYWHGGIDVEKIAEDCSKNYNMENDLKIFYHDSKKKFGMLGQST
jgi:hypothetical protein